ncbi:MAG TPA: diguanylate cyclase [Candidatus Deferrimicrobiaceae bacterium]|jgi:diguanylate cyclase (GGDEF)-like protein
MTPEPEQDAPATILIVEDSPTQAEQLQFLLFKHGFQTDVALNGRIAIEAIRLRKPDIVISDIVMPEMDGYELCAAIRSDSGLDSIRIVLLTSLSETDEVLRALESGADYFITKPYDERFLVERIQGILARRKSSDDNPDSNEIVYNHKRYAIHTERRRILDLLLATYESTIKKNGELRRAHDELRNMNDKLERAVTERTKALESETYQRQRVEAVLENLRRAEEALVERHRALSVLYKITTVISVARDPREMCVGVLEAISELKLFGFETRGRIFNVENGRFTDCFPLKAEDNPPPPSLAACEECLCGLAARTGEIILSRGPGEVPLHSVTCECDTHGHVIVPLKTQSGTVGVLCLCVDPAGVPDIGEAGELLRSLGGQIAIGIENARVYEQTRHSSLHDPLTGLPNRRNMEIFFEKAYAQATRGASLSVLLFDIDRFKSYNDTYGHAAGDKVLVSVGKTASEQLRDTDLIARFGGEEFLVICLGLGLTESYKVAERIRAAIEANTEVTVSIGVAAYSHGVGGKEKLIECADAALYVAKNNGRNRVEVHVRKETAPPPFLTRS